MPIKGDSIEKAPACSFAIEGIDCADCAGKIEKAVSRLPGVTKARVSVIDRKLWAEGSGAEFDRDIIEAEVRSLGYKPLVGDKLQGVQGNQLLDVLKKAYLFLSPVLLIFGSGMQFSGFQPHFYIPLFVVAIITGGYDFARKGLLATLRLSLDMNTLMTIAILGAAFLGDWLEAATVVFLFSLANWLEARSMDRARRAVQELMELAPQTALIQRNGEEVELPVGEVCIGETLIVRPGARIPLDGTVVGGVSSVDQSQITGESLPIAIEKRAEVFAGSINGEGTLEVKVTSLEEDSTIARIVRLVREAQAARAPTERFVDRFARFYTPAAVVIAMLVAVLPPLFMGAWDVWFYRALVLLVIACPCALVIATPVGIVSGLTAAARVGVLIKGGAFLETAAKVDFVAFDKTGTLTTGIPRVARITVMDSSTAEEVLRLAASLERYSEHPLARAIVRSAREQGLDLAIPEEVKAVPGRGVEGRIGSEAVVVGSHRFFTERGICEHRRDRRDPECPSSDLQPGQTLVCVARGGEVAGAIFLSDSIREEAKDALAGIKTLGPLTSAILTGDNRSTAKLVAAELAIENAEAELLPEDKLERLKSWREEGKVVMMVGDGVNDAPALAAADIGVAMGTAGTDVALETADIALMADDLRKIPFTIAQSRRTMKVVRQNIFLSIAIKLLFLALAVAGLAGLWMAIVADMGVSLAVIANSLRLLSTSKLIYRFSA